MTRDVRITIRGIQRDAAGGEDRTEISIPGEYFFRNGSHYLFYEETAEDTGERTRNSLKLKGNVLELNRKGAVNSRMIFEAGKRHVMDYATPFGLLRMETAASGILCGEEEGRLQIRAEYELWADGARVSSCRLTIEAEAL